MTPKESHYYRKMREFVNWLDSIPLGMHLSVERNTTPNVCIPLECILYYIFYNGRIPTVCGIVLLNHYSTERYIPNGMSHFL